MSCSLRVLIVEDDPVVGGGADLRLVLARTVDGPPGTEGVGPVGVVSATLHGLVRAAAACRPNGRIARCGPVESGPVTALVVDDRPDVLAALSDYFARSSCTVVPAAEVATALTVCGAREPDLLLFDPKRHGCGGTATLTSTYPRSLTVFLDGLLDLTGDIADTRRR